MIDYKKLFQRLKVKNVKYNEFMKYHTTFKIGGPCDILVEPESIEELIQILELARDNSIPFLVIGKGSNLLVTDKGLRGIVVKLDSKFSKIEIDGIILTVQAGASVFDVANKLMENELTGFEFASGIPGNIGGAIAMNAGAYGGEMKDILKTVKVLDVDFNIKEFEVENIKMEYRNTSILENNYIVLEATFELAKGQYEKIKEIHNDLTYRRASKQPLEYGSAGSVFKRPKGYFAGKLIEDSGLRGFRCNDAQISEKHCGFIINRKDASFEDVFHVINRVKEEVYRNSGVNLEMEVKIVGEE